MLIFTNRTGLNPSEEVKFDFTKENIHQCTRFVKTFDFESIQKANKGIFIVEFFSSGIASRAIIYKGTLSHFSRSTIAGQEVVILDQTGKPRNSSFSFLTSLKILKAKFKLETESESG